MAQFVSRSGPSLPPGVVTVAELLRRNIPAPRPAPDDSGPSAAEAIPVGALLRREGRAPHALDRPVHPRGGQAAADVEAPGAAPLILRRGVAAAGALLAVGAVFGAAVVTDGTGRLEAAIDGAFPGSDGASGDTLGGGAGGATAPLDGFGGAASAFGAVDAATGLPVGVAPAAFSTGLAAGLPNLVGTSTPTPTRRAAAAVPSATPATAAPPMAPAPSSAPPAPTRTAPAAPRSDGPVEQVGGAVRGVGEAVGGPIGGAVGDVGGVVRDAPRALTGSEPATATGSSAGSERDSALSTLTDPVESTVGGVDGAAAGLLGG